MTILITGSRGKTSSLLASLLSPTHAILIASRNPPTHPSHPTVRFDWTNPSTYTNPFEHEIAQTNPITAVYLVGPEMENASELVMRFVDVARGRDVKRFVLLSAWDMEKDGGLHGKAHAELERLGGQGLVEWAVVRPHFFMENFMEAHHLDTIKNESRIYTAAQNGRKPFISAFDIANVAKRALVDEKSHDTDYIITGSESLSYDDIAATLSDVLGRKIEHVKLSHDDFEQFLISKGYDQFLSKWLADLDVRVAGGYGAEATDGVQKITGQAPKTFGQFAEEKRAVWL